MARAVRGGDDGGPAPAVTWLDHARARSVVVRAVRTSLLVGTILVVINQGDAIWTGGWPAASIPKLLLTYLVPYAVSTSSSVASRIESGSAGGGGTAADERARRA